MVRVVGKDKKYVKEASCRKCSSVLEYTESEVHSTKVYDYTGDCDILYYIFCPSCGNKVVVIRF